MHHIVKELLSYMLLMEYIEVKPDIIFNSDSRMLEVILAFVFSHCWDKVAGSQLQSTLRARL